MPIVVEAVTPEKYAQWVGEQKTKLAAATVDVNKEFTMDELKAEGEKVYAANCVACHQANGKGVPGTFAALDGSKIATGAQGRAYQHRHERQDWHGDGGIQAPVGRANRGGGHL